MSVIHTPREPDLEARHLVSLVAVGVCLALVFVRLWYLQVVKHDILAERAEAYRQSSVPKLAPRGLIHDRTEKVLLAGVRPRIIVTAKPQIVSKNKWVIPKLAMMLGTTQDELTAAVKEGVWRPYLPTPIFLGATVQQATRIAEAGEALPGIGVDTESTRFYPDTVAFSHVLGYVWTPDENDVKRLEESGLKAANYVGKSGLEYTYERELMGREGAERVEVDARRRPVRVVGRDSPTPGDHLILTLDVALQRKALALLKGRRGAVVMLDPNNGEVLCLVSSPAYDARAFEGGISREAFARLSGNKSAPLLNRAIGGSYSPGSTFKIVDTLAAEAQGKFNPNRTFYCPGYFKIGRGTVRCLGTHGAVGFYTAMAKSCNSYFASWAVELGSKALGAAATQTGLGAKTGIDIRSERSGLVPSAEQRKWYQGDTANMGIGQGELSVTPLQMANVAALVANEGTSYKPHLVRARIPPGTNAQRVAVEPEVLHQFDAPDSFWQSLKGALIGVIESGTAGRAKIPGVVWAGKTGSTEHRRGRKTHGWFVGFAPAHSPKVAIAVLVEETGHGGEVSAPIAGALVRDYLESLRRAASASANARPAPTTSAASAERPAVR